MTNALVTSYTKNAVTGGQTYRFMVRARNIYGYGVNSTITTVIPDDKPGKTNIPRVTLANADATSVDIEWDLPNEHSSSIISYSILFMQANGDFVTELTNCGAGVGSAVVAARKCSVPMTLLRTLTLRPRDSLIRVKIRGTNLKGDGEYSEVNTVGATIETEPTNLSVASIDVPSTFNDRTKVVWTALTGSARGGWNVDITSYEVYWDQGNNVTTWVSKYKTTRTDVGGLLTYANVDSLVGGGIYQFKVRAYNKYGEGLFTDAVSVNTSQAPEQPAAPTLEVVGAHVKISWVRPFRNHREVTAYQILLATAAGVF